MTPTFADHRDSSKAFQSLVEIITALRGPDGCPWDKEQTHRSLTQYAIEEAHELADAIENKSTKDVCDELGDLLLQVVLHAEIARQNHTFDLKDVIDSISNKMVARHPHVFSDVKVKDASEVKSNWDAIKQKENPKSTNPFANLPLHLPALQRSQKIGAKTIRFNFDWNSPEEVFEKLDEEITELKEAFKEKSKDEQEKELGDVLFTVAQLGRHLEMDSEQSLRRANNKFETRFLRMRELVEKAGAQMSELKVGELEKYWQVAKTEVG